MGRKNARARGNQVSKRRRNARRSRSQNDQRVSGRKRRVAKRDGRRCYLCGATFVLTDLTEEHVVPKSRGGSNNIENIKLACQPCNEAKGNMPLTEYLSSAEYTRRRVK